jgi:alpha-tubulin suppressor-like RCC1 family protein
MHAHRWKVLAGAVALCLLSSMPGLAASAAPISQNGRGPQANASQHAGARAQAGSMQESGLTDAAVVAAGGRHSLLAKTDGTVWGWGSNVDGQLGAGQVMVTSINVPIETSGLTTARGLSAGSGHSLSVAADGTVWAWGRNGAGQLGDDTTIDRLTPVRVTGLNDVKPDPRAIAAGLRHSLALRDDGTVWAWGDNSVGQLGDGTTTNRGAPVQVSNLDGIIAVAAGGSHSLALRNDGTVWAWGSDSDGQLGDGTPTGYSTLPIQVTGGMANIVAIAGGLAHSLAVKSDGTVWAWGLNTVGQLGDGTTMDHATPVQVAGGLTDARDVAAGTWHSLALLDNGTVWAWGGNGSGQVGDGTTMDRARPVQVAGGLFGVARVAAGEKHSLAVKQDHSAWAWGDNVVGQLGDGTNTDRRQPVQVDAGIPNVGG